MYTPVLAMPHTKRPRTSISVCSNLSMGIDHTEPDSTFTYPMLEGADEMPKRLPPNNRPWPENMAFDFALPPLSPADAEVFIRSLPTSNRNKRFLLLRYQKGCTYNEIADEYGLTATGVRVAVKAMWEKFGGSAAAASAVPAPTAATPPVADLAPASAAPAPSTTMPTPAAIDETDLAPQSAATPPIAPVTTPAAPAALQPPTPPVANVAPPVKDEQSTARPLSINLPAIRRFLGLTPEEFARPIPIEDGESLITRLETGFSRPSLEVLDMICDAWGISRPYLLAGQGEMFELQPYCDGLVSLLKTYLSVATFDRKGQQYWKGSLVDDLGRLIDLKRLNGSEMCRVVRVLYDYLDVEQFESLLERMGR